MPVRNSEAFMIGSGPTRSDKIPASGIVTSAARPYTINASAARAGVTPSVCVTYKTRNASTIVPERFTNVAAERIHISRGRFFSPRQGFMGR